MSQDNAIKFEQYFTNQNVAKDCINLIIKDLKNNLKEDFKNNRLHFIEPSCGKGIFVEELRQIKKNLKITSIDIDNLYKEAIVCDFLQTNKTQLNLEYTNINIHFVNTSAL